MIPDIQFETGYFGDGGKKKKFISFVKQVFGLDFTLWDKKGFMDVNYKPLSFFSDDQIISNVCLYTIPCILYGERTSVAQLSAVGTHPEYRQLGLNKKLMEKALSEKKEPCAFLFLYSSDFAIDYYLKGGFTPVKEFSFGIKLKSVQKKKSISKAIKLSEEDTDMIYDQVIHCEPISNVFASLSVNLTMFHVLYTFKEMLYFIKDLNLVIIMEKQKDKLIIYDLIGQRIPYFSELSGYLDLIGIKELEFRFHTDKLAIENASIHEIQGHNLFILHPKKRIKSLVFPSVIQA